MEVIGFSFYKHIIITASTLQVYSYLLSFDMCIYMASNVNNCCLISFHCPFIFILYGFGYLYYASQLKTSVQRVTPACELIQLISLITAYCFAHNKPALFCSAKQHTPPPPRYQCFRHFGKVSCLTVCVLEYIRTLFILITLQPRLFYDAVIAVQAILN